LHIPVNSFTDSGAIRSVIPVQFVHSFWSIRSPDSGAIRSLVEAAR